jgi:hypothetical protein
MPLGQWSISVALILLNQFSIHTFMLSKSSFLPTDAQESCFKRMLKFTLKQV